MSDLGVTKTRNWGVALAGAGAGLLATTGAGVAAAAGARGAGSGLAVGGLTEVELLEVGLLAGATG